MRVAVVGAGISGIAAAREFRGAGYEVQVFEKSRGTGGRMASRRTDWGGFDHGAQYFTALDPVFKKELESWVEEGVAGLWGGAIYQCQGKEWIKLTAKTERFVGVPAMNTPVKHMAKELDVHTSTKVNALALASDGWQLHADATIFSGYDAVVVSAPCEQTRQLIGGISPNISRSISNLVMQPAWAVLLSFSEPLEVPFVGCFVNQGPLSWIARNSSKPDRGSQPDNWVVHATGEWSSRNIDANADNVKEFLTQEFQAQIGTKLDPQFSSCHRWLYSIPDQSLAERFFWDEQNRIGVCGDWCGGPKVEGAYLSGVALSHKIINR